MSLKRSRILSAASSFVAALSIAALVCLAGCAQSGGQSSGAPSSERSSIASAASDIASASGNAPVHKPFDSNFSQDDINMIDADWDVFTFSLASHGNAPALSDAHRAAIEEARDNLALYGASVSFLLVDLKTGAGVGYNIDEPIFAASAIKGPYIAYICEGQVDPGYASWSDMCTEAMAYQFMFEDKYLLDDAYEYELDSLVSDSIVHSDNDAYRILRTIYDGEAYVDWLYSAGVEGGDWRFADWWTPYSARESAALWMHIRDYITGDAPNAQKLWSLLGSAETSLIRNVLVSEGEHNFLEVGKAGWNADMIDLQYNGMGDAGLISQGDTTYLLVMLSSYPGEEASFPVAEALIAALWEARTDL